MVARGHDAEITLRRRPAVVHALGALSLLLVSARADAQDARLVPFPPSPVATIADGSTSAVSTTFVESGSSWATRVAERAVFLARLRHVQRDASGETVPARGFDVRIGRGGQIYSWRGAFGEAVAPQYRAAMPPAHPEADFAPWVDEVWQSVVVSTTRHSDAAPYFIHQAGVYRTDPLLRGAFFSPTLAAGPGAPASSFVVVDWSQHAHIPTRWRSGLITYTQYRDVGAGILEVTLVGYNAGADVLNRWNAPWGGVRSSSLPVEEVSIGGRLVTVAPSIAWGSDADVRDSTDGYALFRTDAGNAALAVVFGPDRAASLGPAQWRNTLVRTGTARPDARDLRAFTVIRPVTVPPGEAFWARWYFVVGSRTAVLSVVDSYALVRHASYGVLRIAPEASALLGYELDPAGAAVAVADIAAARFVLRALPVAGSVPLYRLVREDGTQVLSPSPYALSDPPYNGATARWELLGYAFEAAREPTPPEGFVSVRIEEVLGGGAYRAGGYALRVLTPRAVVPGVDGGMPEGDAGRDGGMPEGDAGRDGGLDDGGLEDDDVPDGGMRDVSAVAVDGGLADAGGADAARTQPDARVTADVAGEATPRAGCGCHATGSGRGDTVALVLAAVLLARRRRRGAARS